MAHIVWLDEETAQKRAKVVFEIKSLDGRRKRKSKTFPPRTPMKVINAYVRKVETAYAKSDGVLCENCTFASFIDTYLELYQSQLSASTQRSYQSSINCRPWGIRENLGQYDIKKLRLEHIQRYCNAMAEAGLSSKTIKNRIMLVHSLLDHARKMRYLERDAYNPAADVEIPKRQNKKLRAYDPKEVTRMFELVKDYNNPFLELQAYLGVYTGLRRSEMAALTWEDVDFDNKVLHVSKAQVRGIDRDYVKETKTDAGERDVPIAETLLELLKQRRSQYLQNRLQHGKKFNDSNYLFCDEYGEPFAVNSISHRWQRFQIFAEKQGLRKIPFHYLRHTYASLMLASNQVDIKTAQSLMGHSSIVMTADIYADAYIENKRNAVRVLDAMLKANA